MLRKKKQRGSFFSEIIDGYISHKLPNLAASIAFFGALSIAPLFIIVTYLAALIFGERALKGELFSFLQFYVGSSSAQLIEKAIGYAKVNLSRTGLIFSMVVAIWGSALFFQEIYNSLHIIWGSKHKEGIVGFLGKKGYAITGVFLYGVIAVALFGFYAFVSSFSFFAGRITATVEMFISFFVLTFSFAIAYKLFSGAKVKWSKALFGASLSSFLFICGRVVFSIYLKMAISYSLYAAMGSLMTILLWLYFSSVIFLLGAEIVRALK